ncbi:hypothetical protein CPB84DRAFT_1776630 [Gymnopilus junonius]|uniref:Uncharacterized protein n=1 Tax=Gymnopilus junonius TaxID=109634 RepID=A0A9P5NRE1_GYMJU|nr:hypothetical protein CPB84DRAFT_1776630 [Gymnopilus junonius]
MRLFNLKTRRGSFYTFMCRMEVWLCLPLVTATRVLHSTYHDAQCSSFIRPAADDHDNSLFRYVAWATNEQDEREENVSLIVAYQTPYTLTHQDLKEFVSCKNSPRSFIVISNQYPNFDAHSKDKLPAKYRLWGKVWDTCKARQCDYFVLTNYSHWVFGFLSKGKKDISCCDS